MIVACCVCSEYVDSSDASHRQHAVLAIATDDGEQDFPPIAFDSEGSQHGDDEDDNGQDPAPADNDGIVDWDDGPAEMDADDNEPQQVVQEEAPANKRVIVVPAAVVASKGSRPRPDLLARYARHFSELWPRGGWRGLCMQCAAL